jgi:hypothetical protein
MPVVYAELRRLARRQMARERPDHTLQVTALVHEAYLRLLDVRQVDWQDRAHFLALSAQWCDASWWTQPGQGTIRSVREKPGRSRSRRSC